MIYKQIIDMNYKCLFDELSIVKLGSLVSHTEWSEFSDRNSNLIENLEKGPELTL